MEVLNLSQQTLNMAHNVYVLGTSHHDDISHLVMVK